MNEIFAQNYNRDLNNGLNDNKKKPLGSRYRLEAQVNSKAQSQFERYMVTNQ